MSQASLHTNPRICILGGGFGGLYTALNLLQFPWNSPHKPNITLVDQRDRFVFSPLLYELVTGELQTWEVSPPYAELLENTPIYFHQSGVSSINITDKSVQLENRLEPLEYDYLVIALGGKTPLDFVAGASEHAIPFRSVSDAFRLQEKLRILEEAGQEKIRVAIAGGGYSGVELACKLAERLGDRGRIRIVERGDQILRSSPDFNRNKATAALNERNVWIDLDTTITEITETSINLEYKGQSDTIPVDIVLWTVGNKVSEVVQSIPVEKNERDQIVVSSTLQAINYPEIFALGDAANCKDANGQTIPSTAQAAFQEAQYTAWNIWATSTGRPLLPFRYQNLGEMMTLGVDTATLSGLGLTLDGPLAHVARRLAYLYRMPTLDHQIKVGLNWMAKPLRDFFAL